MFVFGVNVPLVEILLILLILLTIFFILTLIEFRNLKKTILIEQSEVTHLEKWLQSLGIQKPQATAKAEEFVKGAIQKGYSPTHVRYALLKKNWPREIIDNLLNKILNKK